MARRRYTERQRAEAVGVAAVEGVTEAERRTGIPKETIHYWTTRPKFAQLRTTARETVVEGYWVGIQVGLQAVVEGFDGDAPLHHKSSALADLVEKYALLNGEATTRTETTVTSGLQDHEKKALRDAIDRILERPGEPADTSPGGDPG